MEQLGYTDGHGSGETARFRLSKSQAKEAPKVRQSFSRDGCQLLEPSGDDGQAKI